MVTGDDIRIGDDDRTRAADRLAAHAAEGRLSVEELEQRLELVNRAVIGRDLRALEADLPGPTQRARPDWPLPWAALALLIVALAASLAIGHPMVPLFILAFLVWRHDRRHHRWRWTSA